jgi:hypothetical protein
MATLVCVALLMLVGCRDRSTDQDHRDTLCAELGELDEAVARLAALEPTAASVPRVRELRSEMEEEYRDVQAAAGDATGVRLEPVTQAYNNVLRSINGVNDQATLAEAERRIDDAAGEFSTARLELHNSARCS